MNKAVIPKTYMVFRNLIITIRRSFIITKKTYFLLILILFASCNKNENLTNSVSEKDIFFTLSKSNSTQYYLDTSTNLMNNITPNLSSSYTINESCYNNSFIPSNQYIDGSEIVLQIDQNIPGSAQVIFPTGGLKYYSFRAHVTYELPIGDFNDPQRLRTSIWMRGNNYANDLNNAYSAAGFEIFTYDSGADYKVTYGFSDYNGDPERLLSLLESNEFGNAQSSIYFVNAEYRIDWHPRYAELFINGVSVTKFDHSFASSESMDPRIGYYWLPQAIDCGEVPSKTYTMRIHEVELYPYKSNKTLDLNGIKLGTVNFSAKRFGFDNNNNGILDKFYYLSNIQSNDIPLVGNFSSTLGNEIGFYRPSTRQFFIDKNGDDDLDDIDEIQGYGASGDIPVVGDWDNDGFDTPGIYRPSTTTFWLSNDRVGQPLADYSVRFGISTDIPIVGNWDGIGGDNVGVYRSTNKRFWTTLSMSGTAVAENHIDFGISGGVDKPIIGDWDGNGTDNIGVYRWSDRQFHLSTSMWGSAVTTAILDMDDEGTYPLVGF